MPLNRGAQFGSVELQRSVDISGGRTIHESETQVRDFEIQIVVSAQMAVAATGEGGGASE